MASYTAAQLQGGGVLSTETFDPTGGTNNLVQLKVTLPAINPNADTGQCSLIIETVNLGTNPTVRNAANLPPFGQNPSLNYFDAGYSGGNFITDFNDGNSRGFSPLQAQGGEAPATVPTWESLGINHNLQLIPGAVTGGEESQFSLQVAYLPQDSDGGKIAAFTMANKTSSPVIKVFYWAPTVVANGYFTEEEETFYGSVRFRGVGGISLITSRVNKVV